MDYDTVKWAYILIQRAFIRMWGKNNGNRVTNTRELLYSRINGENPSLAQALYGIARVIEGQIEEIETKLLNTNINTYNEKKGA